VPVTWSHPTTRLIDPLQGRGRRGGFDIGHEDFKTRRILSDPHCRFSHLTETRAPYGDTGWPNGHV
jgi:hypothetical protein